MALGLLTLVIQIPGCSSLKEKRSRLKPLLARLHREFNISVAEIDHQDHWQEAVIACVMVSNDNGFTTRSLQQIVRWIESTWPDIEILTDHIELF